MTPDETIQFLAEAATKQAELANKAFPHQDFTVALDRLNQISIYLDRMRAIIHDATLATTHPAN